jgi:hypothetical protein
MNNYTVDRNRWSKMTIFEQMGNISSEVGRSFGAKRKGELKEKDQATFRAIDLFDATVDDLVEKKSVKSREVLRAKEEFLKCIYDDNPDNKNVSKLEKYFLDFAVVARKHR